MNLTIWWILKNYTITGASSSTDYIFIVKSKDEAGNLSAASNQQTITTKPAATNLTASQTTTSNQQFYLGCSR
jgi:chitodextrinase